MSRSQGAQFENTTKIERDLADAGISLTTKEKSPEGEKTRYTIQRRTRTNGKARYIVVPIDRIFGELEDQEAPDHF
jgi:hypothetical protein